MDVADRILAKYREEASELERTILNGVPPEGGEVSREILRMMVRESFAFGALAVLNEVHAAVEARNHGLHG